MTAAPSHRERCPARPMTAADLLSTWERSAHQRRPQRALSLLTAAYPDAPEEALAQLPIGERDARLLRVRERMFGNDLLSLAACPSCRQALEFELSTEQLWPPPPEAETLSFSAGGYQITARLPNSADLLDLGGTGDAAALRRQLAERCITELRCGGERRDGGELPEAVLAAFDAACSDADPGANIKIALSCPACQHDWQAIFDVASFLFSEIDAWARRLLRDVHTLASAYGWGEREVLALSPQRRQLYLEMVRS